MRYLHLSAFFVAIGWAASAAHGQGLYGAPEMLRLVPPGMEAVPQGPPPAAQGDYGPVRYTSGQTAYGYNQPGPAPQSDSAPMPTALNPPVAAVNRSAYATAANNSGSYAGNYDPAYSDRPIAAAPTAPPLTPVPAPPASQPVAAPIQPIPQQPRNLVNQMLDDAGSGPGACAPNYAAMGQGGLGCQAGGPNCNFDAASCYQPLWYVSAAGLFLTRDKPNGVWTTYDMADVNNQIMKTTDCFMDWRGGYEVKIGRRFGCNGCWAVEGDYWAIDQFTSHTEMVVPGGHVGTPLIVDRVAFNGTTANNYFDSAEEHALWRDNRFQSAELNLIRTFGGECCSGGCLPSGCCSPFDLSVMAGVRWFEFTEELTLGTLANGGTWGTPPYDQEAYFSDHISNTLIGFQFGFDVGYRIGNTLRLYVTPKLGLYDNHIVARCDLFRGDGVQGAPTPGNGTGSYPVFADKNVFSFMAQIDVGFEWQFHRQWCAYAGYRLLGATGIGLADNQIPFYLNDLPELGNIKHNGDLLVHGGFAGLKFAF
jgi:hypothetical protein